MRYFTALIGDIGEPYTSRVEKSKSIFENIDVITSIPAEYDYWRDGPAWFEIDKLRVWLLAFKYIDGGIWFDADLLLTKTYNLDQGQVLLSTWGGVPDTYLIGHRDNAEFFREAWAQLVKSGFKFWELQGAILRNLADLYKDKIVWVNEFEVDHLLHTNRG